MFDEIFEVLRQFGAGGGDPDNNAVRFLLAAFFWVVLAVVSSQQYKRSRKVRDLCIGIAAMVCLSRELMMFVLEYGTHRKFFPPIFSFRIFPPLEHALTDIGRVLLGASFLNYFIPGKRWGKQYLVSGIALFVLLYGVTAPGWTGFLDRHPGLVDARQAEFGLYWGDMAFRVAGSVAMALVLGLLLPLRLGGALIPNSLFAAFLFLFLDEFLMVINISVGLEGWRSVFAPLRHNLGIWAIPLFLATYWGDLFRQLRDEKEHSAHLLVERDKADAAARENENLYRTLVENVDLGITLIDPNHRVVMANAAQGRLLGRSASEFIGKHCYREFEARGEICAHCPGVAAIATGRSVTTEVHNVRADGVAFWVRIQAFPIRNASGNVKGFIEVAEDITEFKKTQEERRKLEERFLQTQKLESLGILAGGIAHDFNNLLVSMLGNVDLALTTTPPESPVRPYLQRIDSAATRAADLTNQMLAYSGKGRFVVEPINLSRLVEEMGHLLGTVVSKRAHIKQNLDPDLPPVEADATQLRQVFMNLITNASDALGDKDGTITVTTGTVEIDASYLSGSYLDAPMADGRYAFVEVSDTGCGMDRETRNKIFDPFFTTKHTGRGLGLAAVLGIVRSHKGGLRVYSEPGSGTTFKVLFPILENPGKGVGPAPVFPAGDERATARAGGMVLLADDEEAVRDVARMMLEGAGYTVLTAADGVEAVELFRNCPGAITAVILDVTMPRMGGEEAFRELRRIDPAVKVVLSSGYNEQETVNHFLGKGLAGFIQKPYRTRALIEKVAQAINR